jgi:periplasmic divalent cation tolerance protein
MKGYCSVLTTASSEDEANRIARTLVERKLAACVNIVPRIQSIYWWKGKVDEAAEFLLLIKTERERFPVVRDAIKELHSYELPECICIEITDGSSEYLTWISESLR